MSKPLYEDSVRIREWMRGANGVMFDLERLVAEIRNIVPVSGGPPRPSRTTFAREVNRDRRT